MTGGPSDRLSIRPLEPDDLDRIISYFLDADPSFHDRLGVDPDRLPTREAWTSLVLEDLPRAPEDRELFYLVWEIDGVAVGHGNLNDIVFGEEARMHLHLWEDGTRRRGAGTRLVRRSVAVFCETLRLRELFSEPSADNPAPNRTLARAGFELVRTYETTPGWINTHQLVNRWHYRCREAGT